MLKKFFLGLLCVIGVSASYADAGIFGLIGSTVNAITGNTSSSTLDNDANSGINSNDNVTASKTDDGWTIYRYEGKDPSNITECSKG